MKNALSRQLYLLRLALAFLTRVPIAIEHPANADLRHSRRYFSLIGGVIGIVEVLFYTVISYWFPSLISIPLLIAFTLVITGALHEDGLADTVDGIAGGQTPEQRLAIMKDSRVGSFGVLALVSALLIKAVALLVLSDDAGLLVGALITAGASSRAAAVAMMALLPYARLQQSKVVSLTDRPGFTEMALNVVVALAAGVITLGIWLTLVSMVAIALVLCVSRWWLGRRLGGYSGDCLGMVQVISALTIYLLAAANLV